MANDILKTLIAEAIGEGPEGMRLVAETILNRSAIRGLTPEQVVRQPKQYTGLNSPGADAKRAWSNPEALAAAEAAWKLAQEPGDPTGGADHYYAQGSMDQPWWAKSMTPKGEQGGHTFFSSRPVPPGELPQVGTALSTAPTPRNAPAPVTPSIDMAQMRRITPPTQLIPDTFAGLSRPSRNLGDELAMSPIQGGKQQAPLFDGIYDERVGAIRPSGAPIDTQGVGTIRSTEAPPMPRPAPERVTTIARYATPTASDLVRGNPLQTQEQATTIASYPTTRPPSPSDKARAFAGIPDRLPSGVVPPSLYGGLDPQQVAQMGVGLGTEVNAQGQRVTLPNIPRIVIDGATPIMTAQPKVAPTPFPRPTAVGTALDVMPMPPLPIPRPRTAPVPLLRPNFGMGGPEGPTAALSAPRPGLFGIKLPAAMQPRQAAQQAPAQAPTQGSTWAPAGYTNDGSGRITNNESGGVYYERHLRK